MSAAHALAPPVAAGPYRSPISGRRLVADTPHSLAAGGERWPVVDGIPFLRVNRGELARSVLARLDTGDGQGALALLLGDQDDWARMPPPPLAARLELVRDADRLTFRAAMERLAFGPVATYFAHRWSDPTFLSGLASAEAHWTAPSRIFELACGAGHFLREFARVCPDVAGGDVVFAKLWLARRFVAPAARLLCFDAAAPWPLDDAAADLVFCHDAFYFLPEKPRVAAEMRRVSQGPVLVGHAHNRLVDNFSSGSPLAPSEYAALFEATLLYDDAELTRALVEARAPVPASAEALAEAPAISLACGAERPHAVAAGLAMPAQGAELRRNPLYCDGAVEWPSERYRLEYGGLATYPLYAEAPERAIAGPETEALARRRVLLDLPARW